MGDYGGEIDNWSWPRHVGDFALLRVYAGPDGQPAPKGEANVAYRPRHFFPVSPRGVEPDSFVMVPGYPGLTFRSYTEAEMRERAELFYPRRAELYRAWIDIDGSRVEAGRGGAHRSRRPHQGAREPGEELARSGGRHPPREDPGEEGGDAEKEILAWAAKRPEQREAVAAHDELARLVAERRRTWDRDFLLTLMKNGPKPLDLALTLVRWAGEKAKPDLEREPDYQERNRERLGERLEREQKRLDVPTDAALLADLFTRFAAMAGGEPRAGGREFSRR